MGPFILSEQHSLLLAKALDGAVLLDQNLNALLDQYDYFIDVYPKDSFGFDDAQESIRALGVLPEMVALTLTCWRTYMEPTLSPTGFEVNVLNEIVVHMHSLVTLFAHHGIPIPKYNAIVVNESIDTLRLANKVFSAKRVK